MEPSTSTESTSQSAKKSTPRKVVVLSHEAHGQLEKAAKKLKTNNSDFANAAIRYFAESGIDPRKADKYTLAKLEGRVGQEALGIRKQNADIGNRLVAIVRTFERQLGRYMQEQQGANFAYLEKIERNLLSYFMHIEENVMSTLLEQIMRGGLETHMTRVILEMMALQLKGQKFPFSEIELQQTTANYDKQLNDQLVVAGRKLLEEKKTEKPHASTKPAIPEPTQAPAPVKSTAAATGAGTTATGNAAPATTPR